MMKRVFIVCMLVSVSFKGFSQVENTTKEQDDTPMGAPPEVLNTQFIYSPSNEDFDFTTLHAEINLPFQTKIGKGMLMQGINAGITHLNYNKVYGVSTENLENFYSFAYNFIYVHPLKNNWEVMGVFNPNINSNLAGGFTSEDVSLDGLAMITKYWGNSKKGSALSLGVGTIRLNGKKLVTPAISYSRIVNPKFSYSLGFPETSVNYKFNDKQSIKAFLLPLGFDANLSDDTPLMIDGREAKRAQYTSFSFNIGYNHTLGDAWKLKANLGYTLSDDYTLVDDDGNDLYDFDPKSRPVFSIGIAYDLIGKMMKKEKNNKKR